MLWAFILGFVGFTTSFGAHIVAVNLPEYAQQIGVGLAMIGLLIAAYDFAELIAKPIFGAASDRFGMKRTMLLGIILFTAASLLYPFVSPTLLLFIRFLQGVGAAAFSAVSLALVGVYYADQRGRAYGIYNAVKGAGYVISPVVGTAIVAHGNFSGIFYAVAGIGVVAFCLSLPLPKPQTEVTDVFEEDDDDSFSLAAMLAVVRQPRLWPWYAVIVTNMFFVGILFGFLPVHVYGLHYDSLTTGIILSAAALSYLLVQPLAGWLADRLGSGPARTVEIGLVASGLAIVAIPFVSGLALLIVTIIGGLSIGTVWTNSDAMMSLLAKRGRLGSTMGVAGSFKELGDMLGPLLVGALSDWLGLPAGFVICGVLGALCVLLIVRHQRDIE